MNINKRKETIWTIRLMDHEMAVLITILVESKVRLPNDNNLKQELIEMFNNINDS